MTELLDVKTGTDTETSTAESTAESSAEKWHGEDYGELVKAKSWKSADDVLNGYSQLEKLQGMPEFSKYMADIPESIDGYKYEFKGEGESPISEELKNGFFQLASEKKWPNAFVNDVIDFQLDAIKAGDELYATQQETRKNENIELQKQKWQADYEPTRTKIDSMAEKLGIKGFLENHGIYQEPEVVNALLTIANSDAEAPLNPDGDDPPVPTTLQDKLKEIMASDEYKQRFNPGHKAAMEEFMELNEKIVNAGQQQAPQ